MGCALRQGIHVFLRRRFGGGFELMLTFEDLKIFILKDMRMSHVCQPVMLMELLDDGQRTQELYRIKHRQ